MTFAKNISSANATMIPVKRPTYGTGFIGIKGLVPANTGIRWFQRMNVTAV